MEYFEECFKNGVSFQDRAGIPQNAFYTGKEAVALWKKHGHGFLVIVSYCWLSKESPDPKQFHLRRLVKILRGFKAFHMVRGQYDEMGMDFGVSTEGQVGVILDYCSLWQKRPDASGNATRTAEQTQQFKDSLSEINTPYGHEEITAIKLMAVPEDERRKYDDRGWTLFESIIVDNKGSAPKGNSMGLFNFLAIDDSFNPDENEDYSRDVKSPVRFMSKLSNSLRQPPLAPDGFGEEMGARARRAEAKGVALFTNGSDQPFILEKYKDAFMELVKTETLSYAGLTGGWGDVEISKFTYMLHHFTRLRNLVFETFRNMSEHTAKNFYETLSDTLQKPECRIKILRLTGNNICDENAKVLAKALETNTGLNELYLEHGNISADGAKALAKGLENHAMLKKLVLGGNNISDDGAKALAKALETNTGLSCLYLDRNNISDDGAKALAAALQRNSVLDCFLIAGNDKITEAGKDSLRVAWGGRSPEKQAQRIGQAIRGTGTGLFLEV